MCKSLLRAPVPHEITPEHEWAWRLHGPLVRQTQTLPEFAHAYAARYWPLNEHVIAVLVDEAIATHDGPVCTPAWRQDAVRHVYVAVCRMLALERHTNPGFLCIGLEKATDPGNDSEYDVQQSVARCVDAAAEQ